MYMMYIFLDGILRCKTHGILMDGTCHVVLDKSRQHRVDRHGTRWQCLENSCVQCLGEKRVWSNSIFMKFGITHWKVVYHIISGKDSWSISIHFFHLSKHLWHPKVWKSLTTFLLVTSKTRQTAAGCYNQVVVTYLLPKKLWHRGTM